MSASMEMVQEVIINYNNELKEEIKSLKVELSKVQLEVNDYKNKFSCYTKEQAMLLFKIEQVKQCLNDMQIKKSGHNNYQNYNYYELEDINKPITDALIEKGLASLFTFKDDKAYLQIIDSTTGAWIQWSTKIKVSTRWENNMKNTNKKGDVGELMKAEQALQTYARRTLYLQALEIVEPNVIEQEGDKKSKGATSNEPVIPEDASDEVKQVFQQIKKDFGTRVEFNKLTIKNKLSSMRNRKVLDETLYTDCLKTLEKM